MKSNNKTEHPQGSCKKGCLENYIVNVPTQRKKHPLVCGDTLSFLFAPSLCARTPEKEALYDR